MLRVVPVSEGPGELMRRNVRHDGGARCCAGHRHGCRRAGRPASRGRASRVRGACTNIPADAPGCAHMRIIALPLPVCEIERVTHVAAMVSPTLELLPAIGPESSAGVFLKALPRIAEEHAMALMRDGVEEVDGVRDANRLVNKTIAKGMRLLRDGVSEADRAVVVDAHRAGTLRVIVVACDEVGDLGQRLRRCRRAGDGARAIGCLPNKR